MYLVPILNSSFFKRLILLGMVGIFSVAPVVFAQEEAESSCDREILSNIVPRQIYKTQTPQVFEAPILPSWASVETRIEFNQSVLFSTNELNYTYTFLSSGEYIFTQQVTLSPSCTTWVRQVVHAYDRILTYVGESLPDMEIMKPELAKQGIGVVERDAWWETRQNIFAKEPFLLMDADIILINSASIGSIFDAISLSLQDKTIYTTAPLSQSTFRRISSRYQNTLGITQLAVIKPNHINILLSALAFGKSLSEVDVIQTFSVTANEQARQSPVSYAIDYLLYTWFPLSMLTWMLLIPCLAVLLSALRQVIGISVFGIFNPLMLGITLHIAGVEPTLILLACGAIATLFVRLFSKKIFLLYSAKVALTLTLYMLGVIFAFAIYGYLGHATPNAPAQREIFVSPSGIIFCLYMLIVARQVFTPKISFGEWGWRWGLLQLILISIGVYWFVESIWVQNIILGYPEITLLCILLSVMIGRFSGLQLVEYVRFMPLIKYHMSKK